MNRMSYLHIAGMPIIALLLLSGCLDDIRYNMPCQVPDTLEMSDIVGIWQLKYSKYRSAHFREATPISGDEQLVLNKDGTYTQTFHSAGFGYESPAHEWELITDSGEGSKLAMHNLKYFAYGLDHVNGPLELAPQTPDLLRYQRLRLEKKIAKGDITVNYPDDGYVYLYPRYCLGKLVLLQMVSGTQDPDDLTVHNPAFTRSE